MRILGAGSPGCGGEGTARICTAIIFVGGAMAGCTNGLAGGPGIKSGCIPLCAMSVGCPVGA